MRLRASLRVSGSERAEEEQLYDRPARPPRDAGARGPAERRVSAPVRGGGRVGRFFKGFGRGRRVVGFSKECGGESDGESDGADEFSNGFSTYFSTEFSTYSCRGRRTDRFSDGSSDGDEHRGRIAVWWAVGVVRAVAPPSGDPETAGTAALSGEEQEADADTAGASRDGQHGAGGRDALWAPRTRET